jgi:hypothetical protein
MPELLGKAWPEIARAFLKVGATAYGGPAIVGVMQAEFRLCDVPGVRAVLCHASWGR